MWRTRGDHDEREEFGVADEKSPTDIAMTGHPITFGLFNVLFRQVLGSRTKTIIGSIRECGTIANTPLFLLLRTK